MRLVISVLLFTIYAGAWQEETPAPRTTTERPNMSAPGLEQTLPGVLMDASCAAIAEGRSDLTQTPRILPPRRDVSSVVRREGEQRSAERSRPVAASDTSVPEKYRGCRVKAGTTSFAFYANGTLYVLDRLSNQMMQEHMLKEKSGDAGKEWITRTLVGTSTSDGVLSLRSVRK